MKKYSSQATKRLLSATLICSVVLLTGIILAFTGIENIALPIGLIMTGGLLGILFFFGFFAEKSRDLIIDADKIVFPRGAEVNGKTSFQKTVVKTKEIASVKINFSKGDGLIAKDTNFYTLRLTNGKKVTVTLYHYGKEAEKEIFETIKSFVS